MNCCRNLRGIPAINDRDKEYFIIYFTYENDFFIREFSMPGDCPMTPVRITLALVLVMVVVLLAAGCANGVNQDLNFLK
jgi:hypothetical protein